QETSTHVDIEHKPDRGVSQDTTTRVKAIDQMHQLLQSLIIEAKKSQKKYYNQHHMLMTFKISN
ncbi:hypothetical protein FQN51_003458, partial [Onygenales sp. PD_10]